MKSKKNTTIESNNTSPRLELEEQVIMIKRCSKMVKGGRNFSFSALVVVGNRQGNVGIGLGKAKEIADAIRKAGKLARKNIVNITLHKQHTIPHNIETKFNASYIILKPAARGTGLIVGRGMRAVLELVGVKDILGKSLRSDNTINVVQATLKALKNLSNKETVLAKRGITAL